MYPPGDEVGKKDSHALCPHWAYSLEGETSTKQQVFAVLRNEDNDGRNVGYYKSTREEQLTQD